MSHGFALEQRVYHPEFGAGRIKQFTTDLASLHEGPGIEPPGEITVRFDDNIGGITIFPGEGHGLITLPEDLTDPDSVERWLDA